MVMAIMVAQVGAVRLPSPNVSVDHQAHSKPGGPYFSVDWNGDGVDAITLDATQSHTHYFDYGPPARSGIIVRYQWYSLRTGRELLNTSSPYLTANFFVGITMLKLVVTDNTGDQAHAYTYVSVRHPRLNERRSPTIDSIHPRHGPTSGGTRVTIYGRAFHNSPSVHFAGAELRPDIISDTELAFYTPKASQTSTVTLHVSNDFGTSAQRMMFHFEDSLYTSVKFHPHFVQTPEGDVVHITDLTCFVYGVDGRYYAGSRDGFVHVLRIDRSLMLRDVCRSPRVGADRSVLGLAFDPSFAGVRGLPLHLYVSTSTLSWPSRDTGDGWDNGRVEQWVRRPAPSCLAYSHTVISGLPVSTGDHGVNALVFRPDGVLLVAVGGTTNAGVRELEGDTQAVAESPLSGAVLAFHIHAPTFNGTITYVNHADPSVARVASGSVEVFATGLRNAFGMTLHSNGEVYAMDNGPNAGFGKATTGCYTIGDEPTFADKLVLLRSRGFYGHPNWNRGRDDARQCAYIDADAPSDDEYTAPLAIIPSSTNGIVEYTANRFGGALQGRLLLSRLAWSGTGVLTRVDLSDNGERVVGNPSELYSDSGIAIAMGPFGELLMPKLKQGVILALVPDEPTENKFRVIAVTPRLGRRAGGNFVLISGMGFDKHVRIFFAGKECLHYEWPEEDNEGDEDNEQVLCSVPPHTGGDRHVQVIARRPNGRESNRSVRPQYEYMLI